MKKELTCVLAPSVICSQDEITVGVASSEEDAGEVTGSSEEEDGVVTSEDEDVSEETGVASDETGVSSEVTEAVLSSLGKTDDAGCSLLGEELETSGVPVLQEASNALAKRIGTNFCIFI